MLSISTFIVLFLIRVKKHEQALQMAHSSSKLMCNVDADGDHQPWIVGLCKCAPQPNRDASVISISERGGCVKGTPTHTLWG